jgi:hypothetical protein
MIAKSADVTDSVAPGLGSDSEPLRSECDINRGHQAKLCKIQSGRFFVQLSCRHPKAMGIKKPAQKPCRRPDLVLIATESGKSLSPVGLLDRNDAPELQVATGRSALGARDQCRNFIL